MFEEYINYAYQVWRKRWLVLAVAFVVCIVGWPVVTVMPDQYSASAKLYVDTQSILTPILKGLAVDSDLTEQTAATIQRTLLTRKNLATVARKTDMDHEAATPAAFEGIINTLARKIVVSGKKKERRSTSAPIITISYTDTNPQRSKQVVEEVLTLFVEGALGATREDTNLSQAFLNKQIQEYEVKLVASEERLKQFKRKNVGLMPSEGTTYYSQLSNEMKLLSAAQLESDEAVNRRDELQRQLESVINSAGDSASVSEIKSPLDTRIESLNSRLDELSLQFTDVHPDVVSVTRMIADLEKQRKAERADKKETGKEVNLLEGNPVYQELKVALGAEEAQVAALTVRLNLYKKNVDRLNKQVDTIPRVEADLARLDRDYNVLHDNYIELVKRRESAKISFEAGNKPQDMQFKIIEPPRVPLKPTGPKRLLFYTAVLGAGLGAGIGLVILLMQLRPTFFTKQGFQSISDFPVLGTISLVESPVDVVKNRVSLAVFFTLVLALVSIYGALMSIQFLDIDVQKYIS